MSPSERWRMSAGILVLLPAAAWLVVVQHTEPLPPDHKLQALSALVAETPQKPLLLLALAGGLALVCWRHRPQEGASRTRRRPRLRLPRPFLVRHGHPLRADVSYS